MKAVVFTLGCKVNSCESDSLINGLIKLGFEVNDKLEFADLYIINTCAVTHEAEKKSRQAVGRAKKFNKNAKIIITGCASEKSPEDFLNKSNVTLVTGAKSKSRILRMLENSGSDISSDDKVFDELLPVKTLNKRAYIKIQDGCNNFCSYCIIPYLRGRSRSRSIDKIAEEIKNIDAEGVVLTGINISSFNDNGNNFAKLIKALGFTDKRIRLGSLEANIIDEELLSALKNLKNFAPHFHLSLQSGSDEILKKMNRKYDTKLFLEKCSLIRSYFKGVAITTDVISGFPTETEQDFSDTLIFLEKAEFSAVHCFSYSRREGTKAYNLEQVNDEIKKQRLKKLLDKADELKDRYLNENINTIKTVLFEETKDGYSTGYTENYIKVYIKGEFEGFYNVKIKNKFSDGALCEII